MSLGYRSVILNIVGKDNASAAFRKASAAAEAAATRVERSLYRIQAGFSRLQMVGARLTKVVTLPLAVLAGFAIKEAADFQKALNTIQVVTGQTDAQMARSAEGLKKIAVQAATSLGSLTDGLYVVEKSGLRGSKALDVVRAAAMGAKAENADLGTVTNALTSVMASYGKSIINGPVGAMNMLIEGAGLAKTTQQDFANSLSNVVPIASSLHIKFNEVAAAIATMTQHGETAQHATENLRNLITNLAGQNNVAAQAMQQLDIPIANLRKNLGERGLSGTLDMVLKHIAKYKKNGNVVVDAFKHSASATHDLDVMLNHMSGTLKDNSKALADGKMGWADYRDFIRSLGGDQYRLGKDFLAAFNIAGGFNKLLTSGQPGVQTLAGTLQKVFGGIPGMSVALQLIGRSSKRLHDDVNLIGDAAVKNGNKIQGFAKTQQTAAFRADQLKAKIQVLAVNLGDKLLPFALKVVKVFGKMVDWLTNLSPTTQKWIAKIVVLAALLGPLLSIIGRVGRAVIAMLTIGLFVTRFVAGMFLVNASTATYGTTAFQAGVRARIGFTQALTSVGMLQRSLGALAIGLTTGYLARGASTGSKLMVGLGSAAAGAALGFSMGGGPWGAAIGGLIGGLSSLGASFIGTGDKASQASLVAQAALDAENGVANDLLETLKAVNGQYNKQTRITIANQLNQVDKNTGQSQFGKFAQYGIGAHTLVQAVLGNSKAMQHALNQLDASFRRQHKYGSQENIDLANDLLNLAKAAGTAETRWEQFQLGVVGTIVPIKQLQKGIKGLKDEVKGTGTGLFSGRFSSQDTPFARRNTEVIKENIDQYKKLAENAVKNGKTAASAIKTYKANLQKLFEGFRKLGFKKGDLKEVFSEYNNLTREINNHSGKLMHNSMLDKLQNIQISLKTKPLNDQLDKVGAKIDKLNKGMQLGTLTISDHKARDELSALYNQAFLIHEQIAAISNSVINIDVNVHRHGKIPPHAAGGPVADGYFTVGERGYELGYKRGNRVEIFSNAASRKMLGTNRVPGYADGTTDPDAFLHKKKNHDLLSSLVSAISQFLATAHNMRSSSADFRSSARALLQAARQGKVSADDMAAIMQANKRLDRLSARRDRVNRLLGTPPPRQTAYETLAAARQAYRTELTSTRSAFKGSVDATTLGQNSWGVASASSIVTSIKALAQKAKRFGRVLRKLVRAGLPRPLIEQLAQAGPSVLPQAEAFLDLGPKQLRELRSSYRQIAKAGRTTGTMFAETFHGDDVAKAHRTVERLLGKRKHLNQAIRETADDMIRELERALGIKLSKSLTSARRNNDDNGGRGHHHGNRHHGGHDGRSTNVVINVNGITDPDAFVKLVARRLARTVA